MAAYNSNGEYVVACCPTGWFPHWINQRQAVCRRSPQTQAAHDKAFGLRLKDRGGLWTTFHGVYPGKSSEDWSSYPSAAVPKFTTAGPDGGTLKWSAPPSTPTDWPKIVSAHIVLDSVQAKTPGNEHVKQCGQTGPNETCWDPSLRHIINHLYGTNKERCEHDEGVPCEELQPCVIDADSTHSYADYERCRQWVPIGKPVFEDKTPKVKPEASESVQQ